MNKIRADDVTILCCSVYREKTTIVFRYRAKEAVGAKLVLVLTCKCSEILVYDYDNGYHGRSEENKV